MLSPARKTWTMTKSAKTQATSRYPTRDPYRSISPLARSACERFLWLASSIMVCPLLWIVSGSRLDRFWYGRTRLACLP